VSELTLPPGGEWPHQSAGWAIIQISSGNGFWLQPNLNRELETGTVMALSPHAQGNLRSSQANGLTLHFFHVYPERLIGVMTLSEQRFFEAASSRENCSVKILPPLSPVVPMMKGLCASTNRDGAAIRLQLLQIFVEVFGDELERETHRPPAGCD